MGIGGQGRPQGRPFFFLRLNLTTPFRTMRLMIPNKMVLFAAGVLALSGCKNDTVTSSTPLPPRTYMMGFSGIPPKNDNAVAIASIDMWSQRADAAIMSYEIPWGPLLDGIPADTEVVKAELPLANYYRSKGHKLWVYLDPANGLNRSGESDTLIARGRSITEPAIQLFLHRVS